MNEFSPSQIASALGKLGKGKRKTMSPAAIAQRKHAAKSHKRKRIRVCKQSIVGPQNTSLHESVSV